MKLRLPLLFLLFLFFCFRAGATHIVGGEFELKHLSNYNYRLSLNLYFDEINGSLDARDKLIDVSIFEKGTNRLVKKTTLPLQEENLLNYTNVGCTTSGLKTSKLLYYRDMMLSPSIYTSPAGYYVVWERCCRNRTVSNIRSPENSGTVIYMEFPAVVKEGVFFKNSSPHFTPAPSDYACQGELFYYSFASTDPDGDQLVYDMVSPYKGFSTSDNVRPSASTAPYPEVEWLTGYNKDNQIHGTPVVNIDRTTGRLTVSPKYVGLFAFSIRCQEFRNGIKIGEARRDFQLLVKACRRNSAPEVSVMQQESPVPYAEGQVLRITANGSRCIKISYTDPDKDEPLDLAVVPVNFTNNNVFSLTGTTRGIVNSSSGDKALEATLCLDPCFSTNGETYLLDLTVGDDGDDGCGLPRQTIKRLSLVVDAAENKAPEIQLSSPKRVFEVFEGDRLHFNVTGTDADQDQVTISAAGRGFRLNTQSITFQGNSSKGSVTSPFSWEIDAKVFQQPSYLIDFTVTSASPCGVTLTGTQTIEVISRKRYALAGNTVETEQLICAGSTPATLKGSFPTGGSGSYAYTWEVSTTNAPGSFTLAPGNNKEQDYSPPALMETSWFRRIINSGLGDDIVSPAVRITVRDVETNTISGPQFICAGTTPALLTGTAANNESASAYQWEYSITGLDTGFQPISEAGKGKVKDYQPGVLRQTTWYRRVLVFSPCPPVLSNVVEIRVMPAINWNTITGNQAVCTGSTPQKLSGPTAPQDKESYTFTWEYSITSATVGFAPAPGLNTATDYAPGQLQQATWFRRMVRSAACQSTSNVVLISPETQPAAPSAASVTLCPGETATLQANTPAADVSLEWYDKAAGGKLLYKGATYQTAPLQASADFYVQAVSKNGCASTDRVKVTATVRPATADAGKDIRIMEGQLAKLQASGGTSYSWSPAADLFNAHIPDPTVKPTKTTTYTVAVTSASGCVATDELTVTVLPQIAPTNAITVNGDNVNETWYIKNIEHYPNCRVQIFTRWGNQIYDSTGYREPWNGTHNGNPLPMAAYYYIIDLGMNEKPIAGSITLIK